MIIRALQPDDRTAIADIHTKNWQQSYRSHMPVDFLDNHLANHMSSYWLNKDIGEDDIVLVAQQDKHIIGFVAAWHDEPIYLDNLHIAQGYRSLGAGRALLNAVATQGKSQGHKAIDLHVVIGNDRALSLYQGFGGVISATEDKPLAGIMVPHYRISWPNIETLITKSDAK